jgi:shikimate kinase
MKQVMVNRRSAAPDILTPLRCDPSCLSQPVCSRVPGPAPDLIFFIGFSGVGKTTQGGILAHLLGRKFIDLDQAITGSTGKTIPQIFQEQGEDWFRAIETHELRGLATTERNAVIACGGGTVCEGINRRILKESGISILLVADALTIYERTRSSARPLLSGRNPLQKIRGLMRERRPLYLECADWIFSTSHPCPDAVGASIYKHYQTRYRLTGLL